MQKTKRVFAFYLPQFHPIPENDLAWGKGFTEWHNVASAKPVYMGHHQPHIPTELGFYDLRLPEVMQEQCKLASEHGIDGFLFYHYWFNGKPVMDTPLRNYKNMPLRLPYFFCWANENWSRKWDGSDSDIILQQNYSRKDTEAHIDYLIKFFKDPSYVKINGCPVLAVYTPSNIPDLIQWVKQVRARLAYTNENPEFKGIYLIYVLNHVVKTDINHYDFGFDAALMFEPNGNNVGKAVETVTMVDKINKLLYLLKLRSKLPHIYQHAIISYEKYVNYVISNGHPQFKCFPSCSPGWDNSPRRKKGGGLIFEGNNPSRFRRWFKHVYNSFEPYSKHENFVFINAWNEWAEGNHLEPDDKYGRQFLEVVKEVTEIKSP